MGAAARTKENGQETLSGKAKLIFVGLVLAIIGSVISGSYAKATLTNYTGFGMLLTGIAVFVFGTCATATATVETRFSQAKPANIRANKPKALCLSIWAIGIGVALGIIGSILGGTYAKNTIINESGFGMLLAGICFFVLGVFGSLLGMLQTNLSKSRKQAGIRVDKPRFLTYSMLSVGIGIVFTVIGSIVAGCYAKQTVMNYAGFGMLLIGVAILSIGMSGTVVTILKSNWSLNGKRRDTEPRIILGSVWAIGIGSMLIITGSLIASSYAKNTLMNYSGFGMLLAGTGVFVYGIFETVRFSTMGYLNGQWTVHTEQEEKLSNRLRNSWRNMVKTSAVINLVGIMVATCLLFFSLWQLDLIVSGPVWWQASPYGTGWSWPGPGAYAKDYFQCFIWKTTIGQAYDTLFMLVFISFIVLFASAFFWPHARIKNDDLRLNRRNNLGNSKTRPRRKQSKKQPPATQTSP